MEAEAERVEPPDSEQDEEEDVYEVERIIDMRVEEGEVLYRVRWKNYCSDDDTWEPEAHLEDCREVLLAFKKTMAEVKAKKEAEAKKSVKLLPTKSDVFDADSESDSDKDRPAEMPVKKKKKKKLREEEEEPPPKDKRKKKKEKRKDELRPLPAPETDEEEERPPTPPSPPKEKKTELKKRLVDSEEEDDEPVPPKKHKKEKGKDGGKLRKERGEEGKKKKGKKDRKIESSDDEAAAPLEEDLSEGPSESQTDDTTAMETATKSAEKARPDDKSKQKKGKSELKLQGIKDLIHDKKSKKPDASAPAQKDGSLQKLKSLTSKSREEAAPHSSDSSDSSTLHKKAKSKGQESASAPPKVPSSSASSSSSLSSIAPTGSTKTKEEEVPKEEVVGQKDATGSTNLFEKFLLNCEAKDRVPRRQAVHQPSSTESTSSKSTKDCLVEMSLESCTIGIALSQSCHLLDYSRKVGMKRLSLLEDEQTELLKWRTGLACEDDHTICLYHEQKILVYYACLQWKCCDPLKRHRKPSKKSLREITLCMAKNYKKMLNVNVIPGNKLCPSCRIELNEMF